MSWEELATAGNVRREFGEGQPQRGLGYLAALPPLYRGNALQQPQDHGPREHDLPISRRLPLALELEMDKNEP